MARDRPRKPAYEIFDIKGRFLDPLTWRRPMYAGVKEGYLL